MASSSSHLGDCTNESHERVIKIDSDGDLTLVVGKTKTRFRVCSKTLSRSAPFWKRCLYGQFKEAKPAIGQDWVVELPEDNPTGLECLLLLVHGLGHKLPEIKLQLAFEITVLTNKYDMTQYLWAVAKQWLEDLRPDYDDEILPHIKWLWVTKELGDSERHRYAFALLSQIASVSGDKDPSLCLSIDDPSGGNILVRDTLQGYDAEKDVLLLLAGKNCTSPMQTHAEVEVEILQTISWMRAQSSCLKFNG